MPSDLTTQFLAKAEEMQKTLGQYTANLLKFRGYTQPGSALAGGALLEGLLEEVIKEQLVSLSKTMTERIFEGYGPLATFAAKIDIAFALGLASDQMRTEMNNIKDIRNKFAHSRSILSFDAPELEKLIIKLKKPDDKGKDAIVVYMERISELGTSLRTKAKYLAEKRTPHR